LVARELIELLSSTDCVDYAAAIARSSDGSVEILAQLGNVHAAWRDDDRRLSIGTMSTRTFEIVLRPKPDIESMACVNATLLLLGTLHDLEKAHAEREDRATLWPVDELPSEDGRAVATGHMREILAFARRIASTNVSVLVTGESGTGKEIVARAIHTFSDRADKPFIPFNCTAVPREMLESQLFGYRKGAFTGAEAAFDGVIRAAAGGTLFLDEIAEIGLDLQPKLLRFLETHEVHGLGESQPVKVDVRVIAATNADLESLVAEGRFREDLFYRLNVVRLRLPPLRERREEIPPLIDHYLRRFADEQKKGRLTLDDETLEYLVLYPWPGNVRQLVNEMSRVVAYADPDGTVTPALLSPEIQASRRTVKVQPGDEPEIRVRLDQPLNDAVEAIERMMVVRALDRARGNYENAARLLGISRKGLFLKRRRWGMQRAS